MEPNSEKSDDEPDKDRLPDEDLPANDLDFGSTSIEGPAPIDLGPIGKSETIKLDSDHDGTNPEIKLPEDESSGLKVDWQTQPTGRISSEPPKGHKELPPLPFDIESEDTEAPANFGDATASQFLINNATSAEATADEREAQRPIQLNRGLKRPPRYGVFLWWPAEGTDWVHPDDVDSIDDWIPSNRVYKCEDVSPEEIEEQKQAGDFARLSYGEKKLRIRPVLWLEIQAHGYEIGDQVEIRSKMGKSKPLIGKLKEIRWNRDTKEIEYTIDSGTRSAPRCFAVDEFQPAFKLDSHLTPRQLRLIEQAKFR